MKGTGSLEQATPALQCCFVKASKVVFVVTTGAAPPVNFPAKQPESVTKLKFSNIAEFHLLNRNKVIGISYL